MHYHRERGFDHGVSSEITPRDVGTRRRELIKLIAVGGGGMALATWAMRDAHAQTARPNKLAALPGGRSAVEASSTLIKTTACEDATTHNNSTSSVPTRVSRL